MWFIQTWTSRIMLSVVLVSILASLIAFIYTECRVYFNDEGRMEEGETDLVCGMKAHRC